MMRSGWLGSGAACAAAVLAACGGGGGDVPAACVVVATTPLFTPADPAVPLARVSGASPFAPGCGREDVCGTVYVGAEVEPLLAVNPQDGQNLVGVWQQDRWSNGGAQGLLSAFSTDGGQTWAARQAPFSRCTGGDALNGGDFSRATDPWVSFGPDGTAYWMAMAITDLPSGEEVTAMRVSRSADGGDTWSAPVTLIQDTTPFLNDKNAITADPTDAGYVYAVWDRLDYATNTGPAYLSRSTDGGLAWDMPRPIYDPGGEVQTIGNQVVVLSDGTLVNLFTQIDYGTSTVLDAARLRVIRSTDKGDHWSAPVTVAPMYPLGAYDPDTGAQVRDGSILGAVAVGPDDTIWVAWQDSSIGLACINPPCMGPADRVALTRSTDGGLTWSDPVAVNADPDVQAFTPAVHVAADGTVGITYYDFGDNDPDPGTLLTSHWLATSADGVTWDERLLTGPFDLAIAPNAQGLFLGDYQGLRSRGSEFVPFFAQTQPNLASRTDIFAVAVPTVPPAAFAKAATTGYRALAAPALVPTGEWARAVGDNLRRQRAQQFPDRIRPDIPAHLLR